MSACLRRIHCIHRSESYGVKGSGEQAGSVRKGSTGALPFVRDCRTTTVAAASRLRGCRGDARILRDDVLHRARRLLTPSRPDNEDDWQDAAARAATDCDPPLRSVASSCHLVSTVTRILVLLWKITGDKQGLMSSYVTHTWHAFARVWLCIPRYICIPR